uniref:Uncharacterized mitochondrial protein AtMg00810-like n=1 Tax=Nicotiana tabacum TaxID=4097 RepID=A0A1S3XXC9_TOBAC|nr:PREDICTED: uncharacterized mitochondrial protein AtMg00810-like [Nicotiana tabacum]
MAAERAPKPQRNSKSAVHTLNCATAKAGTIISSPATSSLPSTTSSHKSPVKLHSTSTPTLSEDASSSPLQQSSLLPLATLSHLPLILSQLDVNYTFLQGTLEEKVYMEQPLGFVKYQYPSHVCRLHKAIYGLRKAPRAWYMEFKNFICSIGFARSKLDTSLFTMRGPGFVLFLLLYVNDINLTDSSNAKILQVNKALVARFSLKDSTVLTYFLGVEVCRTTTSLYLSQKKYITDFLHRLNMFDAKGVTTPLAGSVILKLTDRSAPTDQNSCTSQPTSTGELPNVFCAISRLHLPFLFILICASFDLITYLDSDWSGNPVDKCSTSSYVVFLGILPISWSSKKQQTVAHSSTEAEDKTIANVAT